MQLVALGQQDAYLTGAPLIGLATPMRRRLLATFKTEFGSDDPKVCIQALEKTCLRLIINAQQERGLIWQARHSPLSPFSWLDIAACMLIVKLLQREQEVEIQLAVDRLQRALFLFGELEKLANDQRNHSGPQGPFGGAAAAAALA